MINIKRFLATKRAKKLPTWLRNGIKPHKHIDKVFSKLGLKDGISKTKTFVEYETYSYFDDDLITKRLPVRLGFTTNPYDLSTMSMRGVTSCMNWKNKASNALVGSVLDPCTGMVYMTSGKKTKYGSEIVCRAIVRFVISKGKRYITVDSVYVKDDDDRLHYTNEYSEAFIAFLKRAVGKRASVIDAVSASDDAYIPIAPVVSSLPNMNLPYIDAFYGFDKNKQGYKHLKNLGIKVPKNLYEGAPNKPDIDW